MRASAKCARQSIKCNRNEMSALKMGLHTLSSRKVFGDATGHLQLASQLYVAGSVKRGSSATASSTVCGPQSSSYPTRSSKLPWARSGSGWVGEGPVTGWQASRRNAAQFKPHAGQGPYQQEALWQVSRVGHFACLSSSGVGGNPAATGKEMATEVALDIASNGSESADAAARACAP